MLTKDLKLAGALLLAPWILTACSGGSSSTSSAGATFETQYSAIITTVAPDYSSSDIEIVALTDSDMEAVPNIAPIDLSDFITVAYGQYFYRIGRNVIDTVTRHDIADPTFPQQRFLTLDDSNDQTSNPYTMVFVNETKAYLLRYNSPIAWIVNPLATSQNDFKLGELDLSAYIEADGDGDGSPEMCDAVIVDDRLYVLMQRSVSFNPSVNDAYVAVFDASSDKEIDTGADTVNGLKGIPLLTRNPGNIEYVSGAGLFVQSVGDYGATYEPVRPVAYSGGLEKIDINDFGTSIVVDDGDDDSHPYGQISGMVLVDGDRGYFIAYHGWQNNALHAFNPATGEVESSVVAELTGVDIKNITVGPLGRLWVSVGNELNPRVLIIDPDDVEEVITVPTLLDPTAISFTEIQVAEGE